MEEKKKKSWATYLGEMVAFVIVFCLALAVCTFSIALLIKFVQLMKVLIW